MSRHAEILATAAKLFSEQGYHGTTVRNLADALHVQSGSLYAHISSKEDLLWRIVQEVDDLIIACVEAVSQELSAEEQVRQLVRNHLALIEKARPYLAVYLRDWKLLSPERKEQSRTARRVYTDRLQQVIEAGVAQGVFWVEDARLATVFTITTVNMTFQWFHAEGPLSLEELSEQYIIYILRALGSVGEMADRYKDLIQSAKHML